MHNAVILFQIMCLPELFPKAGKGQQLLIEMEQKSCWFTMRFILLKIVDEQTRTKKYHKLYCPVPDVLD